MLPEQLQYEALENGAIRFTTTERVYHAVRKGSGRMVVTLRQDEVIVGTDRLDLGSAKARHDFAMMFCPGNEDLVERELLVVGHLTLLGDASDAGDDENQRNSQADLLVQLSAEVELFHDATGEAYATIPVDHHFENHRVRTKGFRRYLAHRFHQRHGKAPGSQAMQDALTVIEGTALFDRPELPVFVRIARLNEVVYIDLGDDHWRAVEIDANGWRLIERAPVKFIRSRGMLPLPAPVEGGSLSEFRDVLNFSDDNDAAWTLLQGWIVGALRPDGPYAILVLQGEQGSSKSTVSRFLKSIIDPSAAPIRSEPREQRDLVIAASANRLLAFDNLSYISSTLSDGLCRLSTGGGFATRELYSDTDEIILDVQRPVIINGIEELVTRADLLDRCIILELPSIPAHRRKPEGELWAGFNAMLPGFLGALYDAVATAIRELPATHLHELPRLADFALWVTAAEPALDMEPGDFVAAYADNRAAANELTLGAAVIADPIRNLLERNGKWVGTASGLLHALSDIADERTVRGKSWPKAPHSLSNHLRRIETNLRAAAISVSFERHAQGKRVIVLEQLEQSPETASPASPASLRGENPRPQAESVGDAPNDAVTLGASLPLQECHQASPSKTAETSHIRLIGDASDTGDARKQTYSKDDFDDEPPWSELVIEATQLDPEMGRMLGDIDGWRASGLLETVERRIPLDRGRSLWVDDLEDSLRSYVSGLHRPESNNRAVAVIRMVHSHLHRQIDEGRAA